MLARNIINKRFFSAFILISVTFSMVMSMGGSANSLQTNHTFEYDNSEITVSGNVNSDKAELIANEISGITTPSTRSILCIFGHDKSSTTSSEVQHNYYTTAPRCKQSYYKVEYCTRSSCDYIVYTLDYSTSIHCH